jgi:hypothetical protein
MADNKQKVGEPDRSRVSGAEGYEVRCFAERHGISMEDAQEPIDQRGDDRELLDRAAERLKGH